MLNRFPPFFTAPYFLALTTIEALAFGLAVMMAIRRRSGRGLSGGGGSVDEILVNLDLANHEAAIELAEREYA